MRTLLVHIEIGIINEIDFNETIETNLETEEEKKSFLVDWNANWPENLDSMETKYLERIPI